MKKHLFVSAALSAALLALPVLASAEVVYNAVPDPLAPNYPSQPFQAQQTNEFGDYVHLSGTARELTTVVMTMSNWALESTPANVAFCEASDSNCDDTGFFWPITVNVYSNSLTSDVPNTLLGTKTVVTHIPWRPEADATCSTPTAWRFDATNCYNGFAFNAAFDLSDLGLTLPDDVIVGFVYNTQTYGPAPTGVDGPYNSLNIAVPSGNTATTGTDDSSSEVFWNTETESYYSNDNCPGNTFCKDTNWSPYGTVAMQINATAPVVASCPTGTTQSTLLETVSVNSNLSTPTPSSALLNGQDYLMVSSGTWTNSVNVADTEYASIDGWATHMNGYDITPYFLGEGEFDLQVDNAFVNWGSYDSGHSYSYLYTGTGAAADFRIFDGDSDTSTVEPSWYGDNSGSLSVDIYACMPNIMYVTGGGNISTKVDKKTVVQWTFGGNVWSENDVITGNFQLTDHATKTSYHFDELSDLAVTGDTATFHAEGWIQSSGDAVVADFTITDSGEPGAGSDTISVTGLTSNPSGTISGGNFQVYVQ